MIGRIGRLGTRLSSLAAVAALAVTAAVSAAPPPAPSVDSIVADYVAARGGVAKIRSIQTLRQKGRAFAGDGREALITRTLKRPNRTRFEFTVQGVTGVYVADGEHGWQVSPFEGDMGPKTLPEDAVRDAMEQADIEGPLVDWKKKGHRLELVGREVVGGREAYKLKLTLKSGMVRTEYIDVKSHYEVRMDATRQIRGKDVQFETTFAGHKKTDGILFPRTVEVGAVGRAQRLRVVVDAVEVNPPVDDKLFKLSEPIK
jgi:outer membrane lipoprotein-sorting protein